MEGFIFVSKVFIRCGLFFIEFREFLTPSLLLFQDFLQGIWTVVLVHLMCILSGIKLVKAAIWGNCIIIFGIGGFLLMMAQGLKHLYLSLSWLVVVILSIRIDWRIFTEALRLPSTTVKEYVPDWYFWCVSLWSRPINAWAAFTLT